MAPRAASRLDAVCGRIWDKMHYRRLVSILLGAWLGGTVFMAAVATINFQTVDRLLLDPQPAAAAELKAMGHDFARMLLRWEAGEQNRQLFAAWETAQLALGMIVFFVLLFGSTEGKVSLALALCMLLIVLLQRILLTPMMTSIGRLIDFIPPATRSADRVKFQVLHSFYMGLEGSKLLLGLTLAVKLMLRSRRRSGQAAGDVDLIDKSYHRHVNR